MGAFDEYLAEAACPSCGDIHWISGQTKFFDPDYEDMRSFRPGVAQPARFTAVELPETVHGDWVRIRPPSDDDTHVTLLADFDELCVCSCECWLAAVLHFALAPGHVTMERIELLDAREDISNRCDYVESGLWDGDYQRYREALAAFDARSFAERAAWLRQRLDARFRVSDERDDSSTAAGDWTTLVGPTQCEACQEVRERQLPTTLTHPIVENYRFVDPPWMGGAVFLGGSIPFDAAWLAEDLDRGAYFRARHPVGNTLRLLGAPMSWGCRCGAGRARSVAQFEVRPSELVLVELTLRVVTNISDLHDIDFIEGTSRDSPYGERRTREAVLRSLFA